MCRSPRMKIGIGAPDSSIASSHPEDGAAPSTIRGGNSAPRTSGALSHGLVSAAHPSGRKNELAYVNIPAAERGRILHQIIFPHAHETFPMARRHLATASLEVRVPGHQGLVIVGAEIVNVLDHKETFYRAGNLAQGGQVAIGENVFVLPGIDGGIALVLPDGVEQ